MTNPIGIISMQFVRPFRAEHLSLFPKIRALGFDFVELLVPEPEDGLAPKEVSRALRDNDLAVVLAARVNLQRSIASDDPAARQGGHDYLARAIEITHQMGGCILGGPLYGEPLVFAGRAPVPHDDKAIKARRERTVEGLAALIPCTKDAGITLALEPLNRFETDIVCTTRQAIEVVDAVGDERLGLLLDTFHMNMEEASIPDAIRAAGNKLVHFQANENHRGHVGTGHLPWPAIAKALADIGYGGPISLEPFRRNDDRVALPIAHWRAPREDETADLKAGLANLNRALAEAAR
ncbi:MAG: sugar phosphate isomerase/epimerase family protein [Devosia sp.]